MERRYRETTRKRKRCIIHVLTGGILLVLVYGMLVLQPESVWRNMWIAGTNCMKPSVFRYQEQENKKEQAPFLVWLLAPKILAYTWQDTLPAFKVIEVKKESAQGAEIMLSKEAELSLLQENIYITEKYAAKSEAGTVFTEPLDSFLETGELSLKKQYNMASYHELSTLIKDFYIVDASTTPDTALLDVDYMSDYDCSIDKASQGPQILIYHSHSQEGFADSVEGDVNTTIVGAGKKLSRLLEEEYGFQVLHHTGVYDVPSRDDAYSKALPDIEQVLEDNPSIQVVIDLHRDAVAEGTKLVKTIDGRDYARFMFFNGICRSTKGPITYLNNPYLKENLAFSFQSQMVAESYFPGITRKIYLKAWRYNMHLRPRNMLIELGAQTNTVEEVMNTCEVLAFVINEVLSGQ